MSDNQADRIAFTELYDSTQIQAQLLPRKNRFSLRGEFKSSVTGDIPLNALNVPQGGVTVIAGGVPLTEGIDYQVDYSMGRVRILNTAILESNVPIQIQVESNSIFGFQQKTYLGTHFNYRFNKDFNIGATWVNAKEKPLTPKINIGDEPYSNHIVGLNIDFRKEMPWITRMVDALPVISTSAPSFVTFKGEGAWPRRDFIYWTDDGSVAALRYDNWKITFLEQQAHGLHVWQQPFVELRAPILNNLRMDPFELAQDIGMDYGRWYLDHMFVIAPATAYVGEWLQSFKEFPPRQKPGSFNLDRVMEAVTSVQQ
jgi:hypothetical protein